MRIAEHQYYEVFNHENRLLLGIQLARENGQEVPEKVPALAVARAFELPIKDLFSAHIRGEELVRREALNGSENYYIRTDKISDLVSLVTPMQRPQVQANELIDETAMLVGGALALYDHRSREEAHTWIREEGENRYPETMLEHLCKEFDNITQPEKKRKVSREGLSELPYTRWRNELLIGGSPDETYDTFGYFGDVIRHESFTRGLMQAVGSQYTITAIKHVAGNYVITHPLRGRKSSNVHLAIGNNNLFVRIPNTKDESTLQKRARTYALNQLDLSRTYDLTT